MVARLEADDDRFLAGELPVVAARAAAGLLADNFLDLAHFPFVHAATFGAEEPVVPQLEARRDGWSFTAVSEHELLNREDPGVAAGVRPLRQRRRVTYRVSAPFRLALRLDFLDLTAAARQQPPGPRGAGGGAGVRG